jgi:hypothetical protein
MQIMLHLLIQDFFGGFFFALDLWNLPKSLRPPIFRALGYRNIAVFVFLVQMAAASLSERWSSLPHLYILGRARHRESKLFEELLPWRR